jgi:hypothetical protein
MIDGPTSTTILEARARFGLPAGAFSAVCLGREWKGITVNERIKRFKTGYLGGL